MFHLPLCCSDKRPGVCLLSAQTAPSASSSLCLSRLLLPPTSATHIHPSIFSLNVPFSRDMSDLMVLYWVPPVGLPYRRYHFLSSAFTAFCWSCYLLIYLFYYTHVFETKLQSLMGCEIIVVGYGWHVLGFVLFLLAYFFYVVFE